MEQKLALFDCIPDAFLIVLDDEGHECEYDREG